jgi:hypothetical protein
MEGYVKLHRKMWDNPYLRRPNYLAVWVYLLTHASHKEVDVMFKGKREKLLPGQLLTSSRIIHRQTSCPHPTVRRVLAIFAESEAMIELRTDRQKTLVTIKNWAQYQGRSEPRIEPRVSHERATSEPQNKNVKNVKEIIVPKGFSEREGKMVEILWDWNMRQAFPIHHEEYHPERVITKYGIELVEALYKTCVEKDNGFYLFNTQIKDYAKADTR